MKQGKGEEGRPVVVVQWIEVEWGKLARGAEQATKRNALPIAYPLPELVLKPETLLILQSFKFSDGDDFDAPTPQIEQHQRPTLARIPGVDVEISDGQVVLTLKQSMKWTDIHRPQMAVPENAWSQLIWNERILGEHTWRYRQTTLNVSNSATSSRTLFLDQPPLETRSDLRNLY